MRLPKRVEICPITDAVVELRFDTDVPPGALLGLVFRDLQKDYPTVENLPILQLPEGMRNGAEFQFQAHHKLTGKYAVVQLGPKRLSISSVIPYVNWPQYSKCIFSVIRIVQQAAFIKSVTRLGLRYINMFNTDVFDQVNIKLMMSDKLVKGQNARLRTSVKDRDGFSSTIQVFNDVTLTTTEGVTTIGSGIDIDTAKEYSGTDFLAHFKQEIELAHSIEKDHFFRLVEGRLLDSLKPTYK